MKLHAKDCFIFFVKPFCAFDNVPVLSLLKPFGNIFGGIMAVIYCVVFAHMNLETNKNVFTVGVIH